jgi:hypothetical protein
MTSIKQALATSEKLPTQSQQRKRNKKLLAGIVTIAVAIVLIIVFVVIPQIELQQLAVTPVVGSIQPVAGHYLPYGGNDSRIFLVSSSLSVGTYPYDTRTDMAYPYKVVVVEGEPCVIINVTIRNDYSPDNPPPNYDPDWGNSTSVHLTADLYSGTTKVAATDLLRVGRPPNGGAFTLLEPGESKTLRVFLAVQSREEITSYKVEAFIISGIEPP